VWRLLPIFSISCPSSRGSVVMDTLLLKIGMHTVSSLSQSRLGRAHKNAVEGSAVRTDDYIT
jgi:hypothetical protein